VKGAHDVRDAGEEGMVLGQGVSGDAERREGLIGTKTCNEDVLGKKA
jgi:hypothetical protein